VRLHQEGMGRKGKGHYKKSPAAQYQATGDNFINQKSKSA
jgi:hypothetical protein